MQWNKDNADMIKRLIIIGLETVDDLLLYQKRNNIHTLEELRAQVNLDFIEYLYQLRF